MQKTTRTMPAHKHVALVAHDNCKPELLRWVKENKEKLQRHFLYATGTTGHMLSKETGLAIKSMISGPMGGRPTTWCIDFGRQNRCVGLLLGSTKRRTSRP